MKDFGIVQGGAEQAVSLVIGKDTVYVHTNIRELPPDEELGRGAGLFEYHEVQYDKDEYLQKQAEVQAAVAAYALGAQVKLTPEDVELATASADITEIVDKQLWVPGLRAEVGVVVTYNLTDYECLRRHVTQADWTPDKTPALWRVKQAEPEPGQVLPWVAGEAVVTRDKRTYGGKTYACKQGHTTQAGWEPPKVPALWEVVA